MIKEVSSRLPWVYESQLQTHVRLHLKIIFILNQLIKGKQANQIRYLRAKQDNVGYRVGYSKTKFC